MLKRIGSGDPCWCGSRKPYGQCHQEFDRKVSRARFMGHEVPSHKIIKTPEQIQGIRESGKPVSYTHLDVYKRQPEALVHAVLTNEQMWDQDLTKIAGLEETVTADLKMIRTEGAKAAFASCL